MLISLALGMAGLVGGVTLGLGLRQHPPAAPPPTAGIPTAGITASPVPAPASIAPAETTLTSEIAGLRILRDAEEARLAELVAARMAAEAELASLRRELAAARREPPPQPSPQPPPAPITAAPVLPPVAQSPVVAAPILRPPRAETAAATGQPRVFIHLRAGSPAAADAAASLAAPLREAGFELGDLRPVGSTPSQRVVRYFHSEDAAAAARLAGRLGRGWAIQDFRSYEPSPASQTLEIWLPDR